MEICKCHKGQIDEASSDPQASFAIVLQQATFTYTVTFERSMKRRLRKSLAAEARGLAEDTSLTSEHKRCRSLLSAFEGSHDTEPSDGPDYRFLSDTPLQYQGPSGTGHTSWLHLLLHDHIGSEDMGSGWPKSAFGMKGSHSWQAAPLSLPEYKSIEDQPRGLITHHFATLRPPLTSYFTEVQTEPHYNVFIYRPVFKVHR